MKIKFTDFGKDIFTLSSIVIFTISVVQIFYGLKAVNGIDIIETRFHQNINKETFSAIAGFVNVIFKVLMFVTCYYLVHVYMNIQIAEKSPEKYEKEIIINRNIEWFFRFIIILFLMFGMSNIGKLLSNTSLFKYLFNTNYTGDYSVASSLITFIDTCSMLILIFFSFLAYDIYLIAILIFNKGLSFRRKHIKFRRYTKRFFIPHFIIMTFIFYLLGVITGNIGFWGIIIATILFLKIIVESIFDCIAKKRILFIDFTKLYFQLDTK